MNRSDLANAYNAWVEEHFDPVRTITGRLSKRRGLPRYQGESERNRLLGEPVASIAEKVRHAEPVPYRIRRRVEEVVELWTPSKIYRLRRDQDLFRALRSAIRHHRRWGTAPDGGKLEKWARSKRDRLNDRWETDAPLGGEALELWDDIIEVPVANQIRRQRYGRVA